MNQCIETRSIILRIKLIEASLTRNIAKYGLMSPFVELTYKKETWTSKIANDQHLSPSWDDYHIFESSDPHPLSIKVLHSSLFFKPQEICSTQLTIEDLSKGLTKQWVELFHNGKSSGKISISVNMYEEKRSEQSTLNTSFANIDLKEEYFRKSNELELEKEELEFYKRKYKKKTQKLAQEIRKYQITLKEYVKKTTPKVTEASFEDDFYSIPGNLSTSEACLNTTFASLRNQVSVDLVRLKNQKISANQQKRILKYSTIGGKNLALESYYTHSIGKSTVRDYCDLETCQGSGQSDILELKFENLNQFSSPRRVITPNSVDSIQSAKIKPLFYDNL